MSVVRAHVGEPNFMLYNYSDIRTVHLEITEKCNASCPMCNRNINGGEENPWIQNKELYLSDIHKIFSPSFVNQLSHIYMCGNYGDPIIGRDTLEAFSYFRETNPNIMLSMNTNGSARTTDWWENLAKIYNGNGYVIFSLDGLEDTNHLYRKNTNWKKIIENATAFINAGGKARWEYIVFAHNEHQVEEARLLSEQLGFESFQVKKSARFFSSITGAIKESITSLNRKGIEVKIEAPKDIKYRNSGLEKLSTMSTTVHNVFLPTKKSDIVDKLTPELFNKSESKKTPIEKYYDTVQIKCKVSEEKSVYISAEGIVQPCCWVATQMYNWYHLPKGSQVWRLINKVGKQNLSALDYGIEHIINGLYFRELISDSWNKPSCADGKLAVCAKTCGTDIDTFAQQYI